MSAYNCFEISATGLTAERLRMDVAANNIANVDTTRTPEGGPYQREMVVFAPRGGDQSPFRLPSVIEHALDGTGADSRTTPAVVAGPYGAVMPTDADFGQGVSVVGVVGDPTPGKLVYEPGNPDANAQGYVAMPNVSMINEMVDMMSATRAYEANVTAIQNAKSMAQQAIGIVGQSVAF